MTWTLTGATVAGVLAVYVPSAPRTVSGGDSGTTTCLCLRHMQPITEKHIVLSRPSYRDAVHFPSLKHVFTLFYSVFKQYSCYLQFT